MKKKYYQERERRAYISNWARQEAQKTATSNDPVWMTGNIPSGMIIGEDGRGNKVKATPSDDSNRVAGEGLASMPPILASKHDEWEKRENLMRTEAVDAERARLKALAEKEGKL